jgi:hypothetical protein
MRPILLVPLVLLVFAQRAAAQDIPSHPALTDRYYFSVGAFFPKTNTQAQLQNNLTGVGASIDFEQSLDMERSKTVPSFFGRWRIGERWRIDAEYFALDRTSERTLDREIQWGDQTFPVNAQVAAKFNFSDLRVSAGYAFFRTTDKEFGAGLGLHVASYDVSLTSNSTGTDGEDVLAPLPVLSLYAQVALTERWAIGSRLDRFSLSYGKYDGSITSLAMDLVYQPFRHFGFGAGYRGLFIKVDVTGDRNTLSLRQNFEGPLLFVNGSF